MNLVETKVLVLCILAVVSFLIGLATIPFRKSLGLHNNEVGRRQKIITSVLLCFGGGVLFSTCMLHIMPEVGHALEPTAERMEAAYLPHLIVCSGFFLIYLVEEVVDLMVDGHGQGHGDELQSSLSIRKNKTGNFILFFDENDKIFYMKSSKTFKWKRQSYTCFINYKIFSYFV